MAKTTPQRLSDLIGLIYDCAIEPERWPETLAEICRDLRCMSGLILLVDLERSRHKFGHMWGVSADWTKRYLDYTDNLTGFYMRAFSRQAHPDGEPLLVSSLADRLGSNGQRIYAELTGAQGLSDIMATVVLREARRVALLTTHRHESAGVLTGHEIAITRLLVPHIRRAVKIIDILDMNRLETQTLAATLDNFTAGVIVVGDQGRIMHANSAAQRMLSARKPIAAVDGFLSVRHAKANEELSTAIAIARMDEATIGGKGIGVPLRSEDNSVAHVLPLAHGDLRTRLIPTATAAVFVTQAEGFAPGDIPALATNFGLTPAETRMLERLADNATVTEAAAALGVSAATARTHVANIFSKTGVTRQVELLTLVNRLVPPIRRPQS